MQRSWKLKGMGQVFRFTLMQFLKQKGNIAAIIILFVFIVAIGPVTALISDNARSIHTDTDLEAARQIRNERLLESGLSEAQLESLSQELHGVGSTWEDYQEGVAEAEEILSEEDFDSDSFSQRMGISILLMMLCILAVSFIVRSVVEEKSSKLVDLLMVSVEPLSLLVGKVLAALVYTLIYFAAQLLAFFVSDLLMEHVMHLDGEAEIISVRLMDTTPHGILIVLITCVLGLLVFGLLSGLSGASCSSIEETSSAMSVSMLLCLAGYYVSIMIYAFDSEILVIVFSLLPFISMFVMPTAVLVHDYGFWLVPASWAVQIVFIIILALLSAKVYQALIVYKGKPLSLPKILKMAFGKGVI